MISCGDCSPLSGALRDTGAVSASRVHQNHAHNRDPKQPLRKLSYAAASRGSPTHLRRVRHIQPALLPVPSAMALPSLPRFRHQRSTARQTQASSRIRTHAPRHAGPVNSAVPLNTIPETASSPAFPSLHCCTRSNEKCRQPLHWHGFSQAHSFCSVSQNECHRDAVPVAGAGQTTTPTPPDTHHLTNHEWARMPVGTASNRPWPGTLHLLMHVLCMSQFTRHPYISLMHA